MPAIDAPLSDNEPLIVAGTGPVIFRTHRPFSKLSVTQSGFIECWEGTGWSSAIVFTESRTLNPPGKYRLTLDVAGNASVQESG